MRPFIFCLFFVLLFPKYGRAQLSFNFIERITTEDGLSNNVLNDVLCDSKGYLWIATYNGLNRYDGTEIKRFFHTRDSNSLPGNIIFRLLPADSNHIAVATDGGLAILDVRSLDFKKVKLPIEKEWGDFGKGITKLEKDEKGNYWVGTDLYAYYLDRNFHLLYTIKSPYQPKDAGKTRLTFVTSITPLINNLTLIILDGQPTFWNTQSDTPKIWEGDKAFKNAFSNSSIYRFAFFQSKYFWGYVETKNRILLYNQVTKQQVFQDYKSGSMLEGLLGVYDFKPGKTAVFLARGGLGWLSVVHENNTMKLSIDDTDFLNEYKIKKIYQDPKGNLWIITLEEGNLLKVIAQKQRFSNIELKASSNAALTPDEVTCIQFNNDKWIIGTYGSGLFEWDLKTKKVQQFRLDNEEKYKNMVWNIRQHSLDTLWIGTQAGLLWFNIKNHHSGRLVQKHPNDLDLYPITTQFTDSRGDVFMGLGRKKGICIYHTKNGKFNFFRNGEKSFPFLYPYAMGEDKRGDVWFVSDATAQLGKWNFKHQEFERILIREFSKEPFNATGSFFLDQEEDCIWYGVNFVGLVKFDLKTKKATIFGEGYLPKDAFIYGIQKDRSGLLWLATYQGIYCFNPHFLTIKHFSSSDGILTNYFPTIQMDQYSGLMAIGAFGKIIYFHPKSPFHTNSPLPVELTNLQINNTRIAQIPKQTLRLKWNQNNISVAFTGINLETGKENRYAYKLKEDGQKWTDIGNQRQIFFSDLAPGKYHLMIRGARKDEDWSPLIAELKFEIIPPFTRTIWFYLLLLVLISFFIFWWYKSRIAQLMKIQSLRTKISLNLHDDIGSRVTNISLMSQLMKGDDLENQKKNDYLSRIQNESQSIIQNMRDIIWSIHPKNDSLESVVARMLQFASELLESQNIELSITSVPLAGIKMNMDARHDLMMIFKEAVHNITKHASAQKVKIDFKTSGKLFILYISDNGIGYDLQKKYEGIGLNNMKERAKSHHWNLTVKSEKNRGSSILLQLKIT